jgi:two-component system copper resistance phosphate regulon response regulator CusR
MKILIVEDEVKIAQAIKRGLEQESYAVDVAYDADDGLAYALDPDYDIVILDRMLPGMIEGLDIVREMRREDIQTPVLMLTAKDQVEDKVQGLNYGADDYLTKPFAFDELLARLRALLRRPSESLGNILKIDDLQLDTVNFHVTRAGKSIALSQKEYALLEYMMRHQNQTLTKQNIITHVWDDDADVLPNTVEVYIGYLRTKIDRPFKGPHLIQTMRGFGYKLSVEA